MNFLAHYYFDHQKGNAEFNFGLLLPDLVRNFIPGARLHFVSSELTTDLEESIREGCVRHISSDKIFHNWMGFHNMMDLVTREIRQTDSAIQKDWFIAHILVELAIDQFLAKQNGELANGLYKDYERLNLRSVKGFLRQNEIDNFEQFMVGFNRFMEVRYLEKYDQTESILYALERICTKVKLTPFNEHQKDVLATIVHDLQEQMPEQIDALQRELI